MQADDGPMAAYRTHMRGSARDYAAATITKRISIVRRYVAAVPDWPAASVEQVEVWLGSLGLTRTATRDACSHVRQFYRWANRDGRTAVNPAAGVELAPVQRRLPRPARDTAVAAAIEAAEPGMRAMLALMAGLGLRCCEVARLEWSDVDLISGVAFIVGKGGHQRALHTSPAVRRALLAIDRPGRAVFVNRAGRAHTPTRVSQLVNAHLRATGAGCTAHQLRHRFATRALEDCERIDLVRDLLGHSSVAVTEIYAQVTPGRAGQVSVAVTVPGMT